MNDSLRPRLVAPPGACDCHMHIYDPRFRAAPSWPIAVPVAPVSAYRSVQWQLGVERAIVVQPNGYAFDNACTEDALRQMGSSVRGIATVRPDVADAEIERLSAAGFRGARCYMLRRGYLSWDDVDEIAARVRPFGWHVQVQLDGRDLPRHEDRLAHLPTDVVIDHNGKFLEPVPTSDPSFNSLLRLFSRDNFWVKLSAPYETSKTGPPRYEDVSALARALVAAQPDRCVWASNWPHPGISPTPSNATMLDLLLDWAPDETVRHKILVDNPARLYGFADA
jgi:D-galactarolactone isomerase